MLNRKVNDSNESDGDARLTGYSFHVYDFQAETNVSEYLLCDVDRSVDDIDRQSDVVCVKSTRCVGSTILRVPQGYDGEQTFGYVECTVTRVRL